MLSLTPEQFAALKRRINDDKPKKASHKRNKYGAEAVTVHDIRFDSKAEAARYLVLKDEERRGKITNLKTQVRFNLLPQQSKERPVDYVADFTYVRNGDDVVEDVKSAPTKTREFVIKRKLMLFIHGIRVIEVMAE